MVQPVHHHPHLVVDPGDRGLDRRLIAGGERGLEGGGHRGAEQLEVALVDQVEGGRAAGARGDPDHERVVLKVEDQEHPATRMLGGSWPIVDEFYHYGTAAWSADRPDENVDVLFGNRIPVGFSRDRVHVLLSIDTRATDIDALEEVELGGDYPQSWVQDFGEGRSFYTSLGHRDDIWSNDPVFRAHVVGGIRWALGLEDG